MAGGWTAVLVGYLMLDNLDATRIALSHPSALRDFVALGGSLALLLGGLRLRRDEIVAERRQKT